MHHTVDDDRSVWKGALAGLAAGMIGSWVMNQVHTALSQGSESSASNNGGSTDDQQQAASEDATMKAAGAISETVANRLLTRQEKQTAGSIVHYAFGSSLGAVYGALAEVAPRTTTAWGVPFGAAVWLGADEVAVPAFGLSRSPLDYPASTHASALAAHLVYGAATDLARRAIRAIL